MTHSRYHRLLVRGVVGLWAASGCTGPRPEPGPPVTALITIDTWRADHFSAQHTPRLWALAQEGDRYTNAWSPIGLTSPAHATMFTGKMPWVHGMEANNHHGYMLGADVPHMLEDPRWADLPAGAFVSAYPAGPEGGLGRGFDVFDGPESGERDGAQTVARAMAWLPPDASAFLWVHVYEPHGPYVGSGATDPERYAEEVLRADAILTPLIDVLVARGSSIVVAADHGEVLLEETCGRQHERSTSDHVLHVPLVRWSPERPRRVHSQVVGLEDVPDLFAGTGPTADAYRLAESGICEPGCSPGCTPDGVAGRDRVVIVPGQGRATLRGGRLRVQGSVSPEALRALQEIPAVHAAGPSNPESLQALGYSEP